MDTRKCNWIGHPWNLPQARLFVDTRIVHAPRMVVQSLLDEYFAREGHPVKSPAEELRTDAIGWKTSLRLLCLGKPRLTCCSLENVDGNTTRVRIQAGYGAGAEIYLAAISVILWVAVWGAWGWLISIRQEFQMGGRYSHFGTMVPALGLGGVWMLSYTRLWFIAFSPTRCISKFYRHLSGNCGIQHVAESPALFPWSGFIQAVIVGVGLLGISIELMAFLTLADRVELSSFLLLMFAVILLIAASGASGIRWLIGQAAFTASIGLSLYLLFPLIIWALALSEARELVTTKAGPDGSKFQMLGYGIGALLALGGGLFVMAKSTTQPVRFVNSVDYWRSHPESHRWAVGWGRVALFLLVLPLSLLASGLFALAFEHSAFFCASTLLSHSPWRESVAFERAASFIGILLGECFHSMGLPIPTKALAEWLLLLFASPVLVWGCCHGVAFLAEMVRHFRLWFLTQARFTPELCAATTRMRSAARIFPPRFRLDASPEVFACAVVSPLPLLPHIIVVSKGAVEALPPRCLVAVFAHEMGHLRHGHAQLYALLRLLSRLLLLGPSFLTGLIKSPVVLEAQADAFAVKWLESDGASRQDLMDALRLMEQYNVAALLPHSLRSGIAVIAADRADWLPRDLRRTLKDDKHESLPRRVMNRWRLLHHLTFHCDLANYAYHSLSDRLKTISTLEPTHKTS